MDNDYLALFESQLLPDKLETDWKKPNEELLPILMEYLNAKPEQEGIVEAFMVSWKHNHPNGMIVEPHKKSRTIEDGDTFATPQAIAKSNKRVKEPGAGSIIEQIITLHKAGKSRQEIVALGFNKSTVARQVGEYEKANRK